jgi:6-phosphogluconate dehydrogenase
VAAAVDARVLSAARPLRLRAAEVLAPPRAKGDVDLTVDDLRAALYASKIASYTQGLQLLSAASRERDYGTDLAEVARIWTAGCIIRAELLGRIREAMASTPPPELLALDPAFAHALQERIAPWRKVVAAAGRAGIAIPGLSASLAWLETLTTPRGSAYLIQAQRDYFGSHTYRRVDRPDEAVHTEWSRSP